MIHQIRNQIVTLIGALAFIISSTTVVSAHFIWVEINNQQVKVYFGEGAQPDQADLLANVAQMKVQQWHANQWLEMSVQPQTLDNTGWYQGDLQDHANAISVTCPYGILQRGDQSFFLHYQANYFDLKSKSSNNAPQPEAFSESALAIIPQFVDGTLSLVCRNRGRLLHDVELTVVEGQDTPASLELNKSGAIVLSTKARGRYIVRGKWVSPEHGTWQDKPYSEARYYTTVIIDTLDNNVSDKPTPVADSETLPPLPVGLTSFGAVNCNQHLYVYGGQLGEAHAYSAETQNDALYALDLANPKSWQVVHRDGGLQGLALVEHNQQIYRLGGFSARNAEGQPQDLISQVNVERYDFNASAWQALPSLPEPRSSFDAIVAEGQIYVIGGWKLSGKDSKPEWLDTAYRLNLNEIDRGWQALPAPPFQRRAIAVGQVDQKIVVVGGMNADGQPTTAVSIFDIAAQKWIDGPSLPAGDQMEGFGSACYNVGGQLIASTYQGAIYRLDLPGNRWVSIGELDPSRFFHRLLPLSDSEFVILGGANMERGKSLELYRQKIK